MNEDDDYYRSEEEFRKLKKEVEHAKAEVEFLKKLLPSEVNGGSRCFNIKWCLLKRPLRAKQLFCFTYQALILVLPRLNILSPLPHSYFT